MQNKISFCPEYQDLIWQMHTHTNNRDFKQMGISHHFQSIAIAVLLTVTLLLPFYSDVRQLPQMEYSAYLRKDSSK